MAAFAKQEMGKRKVTVERSKLLAQLQENREKHLTEYAEAVAGYKEQALAQLEKDAASARKKLDVSIVDIKAHIERFEESDPDFLGDRVTLIPQFVMNLPVPRSYVAEYDAAIDIAKWETGETMELSFAEFNCFVRDEWDWKSDFLRVTNSYMNRA